MKNRSGFSLVELLVGMIIAAILVLTVGVLSSMASASFNNINNRQAVYNDLSYGFKLLQFKVRSASSMTSGAKSAPWLSGQHIQVDGATFGLYQTSATVTDLIFEEGGKKETILSVPLPGSVSVTFPEALTSRKLTLMVSGTKDKIPFNMETTIYRRNP